MYSDLSELGTRLGMDWIANWRAGVDAKEGDCTGVGGRTFLDVRLRESTYWSSEGMGGKGKSGGLVRGAVARRRMGVIDVGRYLG